jgi:hypothetical protein
MNLRGIFPSLGAGGSLIAAVLCAAAVFGGALAFHGGGSGTAEANAGDVTVPAGTVRAQTSSEGTVERVPVRTTPGRRVAAGRTGRPRTRTRTRTRTTPAATIPRAITPRTPPAATQTAPATTPSQPAATNPTQPVTDQVTGTAQRTVAQVRQVAQPVIDQVPQPAQEHANSVTDTVEQVAGTVDQTVDGLTGTLLPHH